MENVSVLKKRGSFSYQKVSAFMEIGVFFSIKIPENGSFFKSGNADICPPFLRQVRVPGG